MKSSKTKFNKIIKKKIKISKKLSKTKIINKKKN
jgi:hypothetical protein